jgi:hypothetical protein
MPPPTVNEGFKLMRELSCLSLVLTFAFAAQAAGAANSYEFHSPGLAEKYGIDYQGFENAANMSATMTETRHHRFGQQTGIGASTAQTESATVESMPTVNYTPTTTSPAVVPTSTRQPFQRVQLFSQSMLSTPALRPIFGSPNTFLGNDLLVRGGSLGDLDRLNLIPMRTEDLLNFGGGGRRNLRGSYFDVQLTNPFRELNR